MSVRDSLKTFSRKPVAKEITSDDGEKLTVYIRRMSLGEADSLNNPDEHGKQFSTAVRLLSRFMGDEAGAPIFDLQKPEDVTAIQEISAQVAGKILEYGNAVNVPKKEADEKKE